MSGGARRFANLLGTAWLIGGSALAGGAGCDDGGEDCSEPTLVPQVARLNLGDLRALGADEVGNPASLEAVPFEFVLLLQSKCTAPVVITKACIIGDAHNGEASAPAFTLEGPIPLTVPFRTESALRLTYDHTDPNTVDADADGQPDPDSVAIVIQSNAVNAPTLVVPVCARVIAADGEPAAVPCVSPVVVPAGQADLSLCQ